MHPIGQALAPYLSAGCCAVIELVSHALFIGEYYFTIKLNYLQYDNCHVFYPRFTQSYI